MQLLNKHILLGVTGGIAAYKSADLVRRLRDAGAQVRVAMTAAAQTFVTPQTFQALSAFPVLTDNQVADSDFAMDHIALARWAHAILIAPATADFMAKLAHGFASDVLSTLCMAAQGPIFLAPAMNQQMWANGACQANKQILLDRGHFLFGPATGSQACGDYGLGRMLEPADIVLALEHYLTDQSLQGLRVMITAGPTREAIDPVRYLTNHSSGKMGYALAQAAVNRGAEVLLVSGPTALNCPVGVERISVTTAEQMYATVMARIADCDIFIGAAAVADYRAVQSAPQKMKKSSAVLNLELTRNPDILTAVAELEKPPFTVGFAAETESLESNAQQKLIQKNIDMIAANNVMAESGGFDSEQNALTVLWNNGREDFSLRPKIQLAGDLLVLILARFREKRGQVFT